MTRYRLSTEAGRGRPRYARGPVERRIPGRCGVENAQVLMSDIGWPEEAVRLHLADAQLDLSHQQTVQFDEAWVALDEHELAMEVDIGACVGASTAR